MNIGAVIKSLRTDAGISQGNLADACKVTQGFMSQIERNKRVPHMNTLEKIAETLGVPLPVMMFLAMEKSDVSEQKREAFSLLVEPMRNAIGGIFKASPASSLERNDEENEPSE